MAAFDPSMYFKTQSQINEYNRRIKSKVLSKSFFCDVDSLVPEFPCMTILLEAQLSRLLTLDAPVYPNLVRVFYTNLHNTNVPGGFRTTVCGKTFSVTPQFINRLLNITLPMSVCAGSHKEFREFEGLSEEQVMGFVLQDALVPHAQGGIHVLKKAHLSFNMHVLTEIVQCILLPRKGHVDSVNLLDIWVMGALGLRIPIDIGYLICEYMTTAHLHSQQSLPYGSLITLILQKFHIELDESEDREEMTPRQCLSLQTYHHKGWEKADGVWRIRRKTDTSGSKRHRGESSTAAAEMDSEEEEGRAPTAPARPSIHPDAQYEALMASIASLSESVHRRLDVQDAALARLAEAQDARFTSVEQRLQSIEDQLRLFTGDL